YGETVLLVLPVGRTRHVGFILNRPLDWNLSALLPSVPTARKVVDPVRFGGPVMPDVLFAVSASKESDAEQSVPAFGGTAAPSSVKVITGILEREPNAARYFLGFVGWDEGELEEEIAKGFWYVTTPNADHLFRTEPGVLWKELVGPLERRG